MKIRTRLTVAGLLALLPIWIGLGLIAAVAGVSDMKKTYVIIEEYTGSVVTGLGAFFDEAAELAVYLAAFQAELDVAWAEGGSRLFQTVIRDKAGFNDAGRIDENGYVYLASVPGNPWQGGRMTFDDSDPNAEPLCLAGSDYWINYIEGNRGDATVFVVEPYVPDWMDHKVIFTGCPIVRDGRCVGAVNVLQTLTELSNLYSDLTAQFIDRFGTDAQMHLVTDGGQLVSSLRYTPEARGYRDILFGNNDIVSSDAIGREVIAAFNESLRAEDNIITARIDGRVCYLSASRIGDTPFTLCFAVPRAYMRSATQVIIITDIVSFIAIAILLIVILRAISGPMVAAFKLMDDTMRDISSGEGDLTARIEVKGADEIESIGGNFNKFMGTLHDMIEDVSESAESLSGVGAALSDRVTAISGDVSTIAKDIETLSLAAEEQGASVTETSSTITQIAQNIESLTSQIESQSAAVTESSASVQQMVSNVETISENIAKASQSFNELKGSADGGRESIAAVQDLVAKLTAQSDSLLEANSVIDNIASQTNLLAMNAAIEAAHAGDSGKGFAVVADEIRKLAEDSAAQSKTIATGLKVTIESIRNIAQATAGADGAFGAVASRIAAITSLVNDINLACFEQSEGSRQVLGALQDIENVTARIRDGAVEMNSGTESILTEVARLSGISQSLQDRSSSIAKAVEAISGETAEIVKSSGANSEAVNVLLGITGKFKL